MRILILSFYYEPDLSAGSFRSTALVKALLEKLPIHAEIEVITTLPNRYSSFSKDAPEVEEHDCLSIRRIKLPFHKSGMLDQSKAFIVFAKAVLRLVRSRNYTLVYATSSRLMTAALAAWVGRMKCIPVYLDIRDIFVDTIKDVLPRNVVFFVKPILSLIERLTITQASKVALVSGGFEAYFQALYPNQQYVLFTNGVDNEFVTTGFHSNRKLSESGRSLKVLYAGNIGEGQGLHNIIPELAMKMKEKILFHVIGDGGRKAILQSRILENRISNVVLEVPVSRNRLIEHYQEADILFLHLNDYPAFRKVLPSKLFEYAAMGKPIWAGVAGYAAEFIEAEILNAAVFHPGNAAEAEQVFASLLLKEEPRVGFIKKFARSKIMDEMAIDILNVAEGR